MKRYTSYSYSDPFNRLTSISYPDTGLTSFQYGTVCGQPTQTSILLGGSSNYIETAALDGLCEVTQTALISDPQNPDYTDMTYDGEQRLISKSNPYRTVNDTSYGATAYAYDPIGRTTSVTSPDDGSPATTSYSGRCSTVKDPANKQRILCYDALARLTNITEDPGGLNYQTGIYYAYGGYYVSDTHGRTFLYDSLGRIYYTIYPESGITYYMYRDAGSNLCSGDPMAQCRHYDARGAGTLYTYDALNRLTSKSYTDGTPTATFSYDETSVNLGSWTSPTLAYPLGRLTHTTTISGGVVQTATVQDYDKMGRTQNYWQCPYPIYYCGTNNMWAAYYHYDLAGDVTWWNHPAGFTIHQPVDGARHVINVASTLSDSTHPATLAYGPFSGNSVSNSIAYTPWGAVSQLENGCVGANCTNLQETYFYNKRLQMAVAELGTSSNHAFDSCRVYNYYVGVSNASACSESPSNWPQGTDNNGNVAGYFYHDNVNTGLSHAASYHYDGVNRLWTAAAAGNSIYSQTFSYDARGNMTCSASPPEVKCLTMTYNSANQITNSGYTYDAAGDLTGDGTYTYQWDAEARLTRVLNGGGTAITTNLYNALGQRVVDIASSSVTLEAYGADGSLLWRYTGNSNDPNQRAFVPFQGRILAEYSGGVPTSTVFDHPDGLGSISTSSDYTGNYSNEKLFYPFGEMWTGAANTNYGMHQTFAQLPDYDVDPDQYNTLHRHYSPMGRWLSPDPAGKDAADDSDPQTWNMYAYVRNNPTTLTDPTGERYNVCQTDVNGNQTNCADISDEQFAQFEQANKDTLTFTGNGNVLQNGTVIGSYDQTSVDPTPGLLAVGAGTQTAERGIITGAITIAVFATAYASTYAIPAVIAGLTAMGDTGAVGSGAGLLNKIHHIFGDPGHNLSSLVQQFGSPAAAYAALEQATTAQVVAKGLTGQFQEVVNVGGTNVTVRGAVVDGVVRIGTAFR